MLYLYQRSDSKEEINGQVNLNANESSHLKPDFSSQDNKIKILSQVIIKDSDLPASSADSSNVDIYAKSAKKSHQPSFEDKYNSSEEDKTSGSEYLPSDDASNTDDDTAENNKNAKNCKLPQNKTKRIIELVSSSTESKNYKTVKVKVHRKKKSVVESKMDKLPHSTTATSNKVLNL